MAGQHPSGLSWADVGEEHLSHSAVIDCSQALWATGVYHQPRNAVEVLEEEGSLQYQLDCGKGTLYPHCLRECLEG